METIGVLSRKGGVGKTTLATHLAVLAGLAGHRTVLIDTDPQRSATAWWRLRDADTPQLVETTPGELKDILEAAAEGGVDVAVVDARPERRGRCDNGGNTGRSRGGADATRDLRPPRHHRHHRHRAGRRQAGADCAERLPAAARGRGGVRRGRCPPGTGCVWRARGASRRHQPVGIPSRRPGRFGDPRTGTVGQGGKGDARIMACR